ncbi:centromere protein T-like [Brachionichthys hirsutus]|uniref:centromere protein T-like n=1 Tax=Brachionichthys hirsutus TaxID=412623 RepID=UPI0036046618
MDPTEDLSARVLLKHILSTETPRTPVTRSVTKTRTTTLPRRSGRFSSKDAGAQSPQDILRRSMRHKISESITRKSLLRRTHTPGPTALLLNDGDTPRCILRNIMQTEPVRSPAVHKHAESAEPQPSSANSSMTRSHQSIELSGLDLPDLTIGNVASAAKGLSRKRPHRSLNVTAFEKRLRHLDDVGEETEKSIDDHSSLSLSRSTSLSLKTPFVDVQTEKRGLQRRVTRLQKMTVDEFGAAVNKRQMGEVSGFVEQGPSDTAFSEGFTLGLSKLNEPDLTTDILHCNTALYAKPDAMTSNISVMAPQLQRQVEVKQRQVTEAERDELVKERPIYLDEEEDVVGDASAEENIKGQVDIQSERDVAMSQSEEEDLPDSQTEEDDAVGPPAEEAEEDAAATSQSDEEDAVGPPAEEAEEDAAATSQSDEEEVDRDTQTEEDVRVDTQTEELAADSQAEEEMDVAEYQMDQENPAGGDFADSQDEDAYDGAPEEQDDEHVSGQGLENVIRRAHRSGSGIVPITESGRRDASRKESDAGDEKSFRASHEDGGNLGNDFPEEAAAQDPAVEEEEEWEDGEDDEENQEVPSKTPAFVREKRKIFNVQHLASPSVLKNIPFYSIIHLANRSTGDGLPAPKPKTTRKRSRPAAKEGGLPKSYLMNVFKHFAKTKVSADIYPVLKETMDKFFERLAEDLEAYALHAKRKTLEVEDAVLLLKRQGHVNDKVPVEVLIEKYLRMDQRRLLIPVATQGNVVIPVPRR